MKKQTKEFINMLKMTQEELGKYVLSKVDNNSSKVYNKHNSYIYIEYDEGNPILTSHLDTINTHDYINKAPEPILAIYGDDTINNLNEKAVLGADDRAGVWVMLQLLYSGNINYNYLFCYDEEIGGVGSKEFANEFKEKLYKSSCFISLDRRGSNEIASYGYDNDDLIKVFTDIGYKPVTGSFTDCVNLSRVSDIACCNLSVGYNYEHTDTEVQDINVMYKVLDVLHKVSHNFVRQYHAYDDIYSDMDIEPLLCECCGEHAPLYVVTVGNYDYQVCSECKEYYV